MSDAPQPIWQPSSAPRGPLKPTSASLGCLFRTFPRKLLVVRMTKFGKSREVPLHSTTIEALALYARERERLHPRSGSITFFVNCSGKQLRHSTVQRTFRRLVNACGIGVESPVAPRIHDLRHTFAVRTLVGWYQAGENVQACLPRLSTYLGHLDPHATYWYLSAVPELLGLAAGRLEAAQVNRA